MFFDWSNPWYVLLAAELVVLLWYFLKWAMEEVREWWPGWRLERRNRRAIRKLWHKCGRKPPRWV